ncbi:hypothetical protein GAG38_22600 [Salmonella enterica]|nr:hypothetical protein [Salmonella enterica]EBJ7261312.1 hypothetical protein [Salmonella enterica]ECH8186136.1 hypothetical protein [Salmonella enterica subsp. enterica serovar Rissen]EDC3801173.1 hypothetical protein [Salmonella enterica]EEJ6876532.1 hypothetical protein [Salmonella enterica subsp. houtenae]
MRIKSVSGFSIVFLEPDDFETGDMLKPGVQKAADVASLVIHGSRVIKNELYKNGSDNTNTVRAWSWLDREFVRTLQPLVQDIVRYRIERGGTTEEATTQAQQVVRAVTSAFRYFT